MGAYKSKGSGGVLKSVPPLFLLLLLVLGAAGCTGEKNPRSFSWRNEEGEKLTLSLSQHPYSESLIKGLSQFEEATGISVTYATEMEGTYFENLEIKLKSRSPEPDLFMTGVYQLWNYLARDYLEPLDPFLDDPLQTASDYNFEDFFPTLIDSLRCDGESFRLGEGPVMALPLGFEIYPIAYNRRIFNERGLEPPETLEDLAELCGELKEFNGPDSFALALRGSANWSTIHTGYITVYRSFGAVDLIRSGEKWVSLVDGAESLRMNRYWVDLIREGGPPDWESYDWYRAGAALGDGRAAMLFDADIVGFFQNTPGASREAGNIAWVPTPVPEGKRGSGGASNLWIWSLAMNGDSRNKPAAWLLMEYFTHPSYQRWSAVERMNVNPPRRSVFLDPEFQRIISQAEGYGDTLLEMIDRSAVQFTPNPKSIELYLLWTETLRKMVLDRDGDMEEELSRLRFSMESLLNN